MECKETIWNGFKKIEFNFEGRTAVLVFPEKAVEGNKWLFKTEYFGAFPDFEIEMVRRGYHLASLQNETRWVGKDDIDIKARFADFLNKEFSLHKKCVPVGMSCGGMHGVYFAAKYPQYVAALYLDAPVINLLSCPCGVGDATDHLYEEFKNATGKTTSDMINYRNHPQDVAPKLIENNIPVFLVAGDSDTVVPYHENGKFINDLYVSNNAEITTIVKPGCDHHPHGLVDNTPIIEFVLKHY